MTFAAALALSLLAGAKGGDCLPAPDTIVCEQDDDCPSEEMCNVLEQCAPAYVTLSTDAAAVLQGVPLVFTVEPRRLDIEVLEGEGGRAWHIDRWDVATNAYVRLQTEMPYGCRATGCAGGEPTILCVDPEPATCAEYHDPFDIAWSGYFWVVSDIACGEGTVQVWEHRLAPAGAYRLTFRYGHDAHPGDTPSAEQCAVQDREAMTPFSIVSL